MIVRAQTLPYMQVPRSLARTVWGVQNGRGRGGPRGMGEGDAPDEVLMPTDPETIGCLQGQGPLQVGQSYCPAPPASPTTDNWDGKAATAPLCFNYMFPFVGRQSGATCIPVISLPSPWPAVITGTIGGLALLALFRGGRR